MMFRNLAFDENNEVKLFTPEAAYSGILGALTAGFLEGPVNISNNIKVAQYGKMVIESNHTDALVQSALTMPEGSAARELAQRISDGEVKPGNANVGELVTKYAEEGGDTSFLVSHISGIIAGELGADVTMAKRAGLLHDLGKAAEIHFHEGVDGDSEIQHHGFLQQGHSTKQVSVVHLVAAVTGDLYIHIAHERCHGQGVIPQVEGAKDHGVGKGTVVLVGSAILTNQHDIDDLLMLQKIIRRGGNGDLIRGDGDAGEVRGQGRVGIDIRGQGADGSAGITALGRVFDDDLTKCALDEDGDEEHGR